MTKAKKPMRTLFPPRTEVLRNRSGVDAPYSTETGKLVHNRDGYRQTTNRRRPKKPKLI